MLAQVKKSGSRASKKNDDIHILLSHNHWDHIQGFPFFAPIYQPDRNIFITPGQTSLNADYAIHEQMSGSYFSVDYKTLPSNIQIMSQP
jgi:phosphoribosyl 1,2-cyclic phosphodiesterase